MADSFDGLAGDWPLVGRVGVVERFRTELSARADADDGVAAGLAMVGPAGVGKTRLATECTDIAERAGWRIGRVTGSRAAASIPFGAAASLLSADTTGSIDFATIIRRAYEVAADGGPMCLFVDDAHLLDDASITLVQHLAASRDVVVVITARSDQPIPTAVSALWRDGSLARVDLDGLDRADHDALVAAALGGPIEDSAAARLFGISGGNPLFARELLMAAAEDNALLADGRGGWRMSRMPRASGRLAELVGGRVGALDDEERRCLETIAVAEPLGIELVEGLGFGAAVSRLERRRLVRAAVTGVRIEVSIAHPLYAEVVRDRLLPLRARNIRRALADQLEQTGARRRGDTSRIARWRLDAGLSVSIAALLSAADEAAVAGDPVAAERFATAAHDATPSTPTALALAALVRRRGDGAGADDLLRAALSAPSATPAERAVLAQLIATNLFWNLGRDAEALAMINAFTGIAPSIVADMRRAVGADAALQETAWLRADTADGGPDGRALLTHAIGRLDNGDGLAAMASLAAAENVFEATDQPLALAWCRAMQADAHLLLGDIDAAAVRLGSVAAHARDRLFGEQIDRTAAALAIAAGDRPGAAEILRARLSTARDRGRAEAEQALLHDLLRLGLARPEEIARIGTLAAAVATQRGTLRARHATAAGDGAKLALLAAELETEGFSVWACEVSLAAVAALTEPTSANPSGADRQIGFEQRRAARLRAAFPRATLFAADADAPAADVQLRPGELAVVQLAVRGLSDREIGEQLHLSVRTVGNYLLRAYRRLGVRGRDELAGALDEASQSVST